MLAIPPAKLVIDGDATHTYGITELGPTQVITNGQEVYVPILNGSQRTVHIFDRNDASRPQQEITLVSGRRTNVPVKPH